MSDAVLLALIAGVPAMISAAVGAANHVKLRSVDDKTAAVATSIDGRMSQLVDASRQAGVAQGLLMNRRKDDPKE